MYAVRIAGTFKEVTTRTVVKQEKPHPPMSEAVGGDKELHFKDVEGIIGGFRTPVYEKGISVPGCHVHFIDAARTSGGHVLGYVVDKATIELCPASDLELRLPLTQEFSRANLSPRIWIASCTPPRLKPRAIIDNLCHALGLGHIGKIHRPVPAVNR